ncbi:MAG: hypothetical protein ACD_7C00139G0002, partial [uncultured bacterium]
ESPVFRHGEVQKIYLDTTCWLWLAQPCITGLSLRIRSSVGFPLMPSMIFSMLSRKALIPFSPGFIRSMVPYFLILKPRKSKPLLNGLFFHVQLHLDLFSWITPVSKFKEYPFFQTDLTNAN